jgi:hypothetical protein
MGKKDKFDTELHKKAVALYEQLRPEIETDENIGQMIVMDVVSGDYEIGVLGIEASYRLQKRHPEAMLYALRIGFKTVESFGGVLERMVV